MKKYLLIFLIMIIWITGSYFSLWNSYIIPYPEKVFFTAVKLLKSGELFKHMFTSISRIFWLFYNSYSGSAECSNLWNVS